MVVKEKKTHVDAAKYCAKMEGSMCSDKNSPGVAIAKQKGAEDIWLGALDAKDAENEKEFVCQASCNEGKLFTFYFLGVVYSKLQRMLLTLKI